MCIKKDLAKIEEITNIIDVNSLYDKLNLNKDVLNQEHG